VNPGPCEWPVSYAECGPCEVLDALDADERLRFETIAAEYLWNWTGRVYGACTAVVRPCRSDCDTVSTFWGGGPYPGGAPWHPVVVGGRWYNITCGRCGDPCSCGGNPAALRLPGPVASVEQVLLDGAPLDAGSYRVDNRALLVRTDGAGWPTCQDIDAPATGEGTWDVSYTMGLEVPLGGQAAAGTLACELAKAACSDASCQLPQRVQTVTRQGVTVAVLDAFEDVEKGRTGIWAVDAWVASVTQPRRGGTVMSPDIPHPRHRVTTWPPTS
jgi:hypothetical protein